MSSTNAINYRPTFFTGLPADGILKRQSGQPSVEPYCFDDGIAIAVDVALATGRPLLVMGEPGSGKSRLADAVAAAQGWNLLSCIITSHTRLETLTADVDQLRRLHDANVQRQGEALKPDGCYLNPGIFWWAFDPDSARHRGLGVDLARTYAAELDYPGIDRGRGSTVLLLDEIDKAEPDLPNDLLEPLDRRRFSLPDGIAGARQIAAPADAILLTIITTNGERELPPAFIRRCVLLHLNPPELPEDASPEAREQADARARERLVQIGCQHLPPKDDAERARIEAIARLMHDLRTKAAEDRLRRPGTAEFLDAIRACDKLGVQVSPEDPVWRQLEQAVLDKGGRLRRALGTPDPL
jgi:MoxR-like ATPase